MNDKIVTKGICHKCNQIVSKSGAKSHIKKCYGTAEEKKENAFILKAQWPHKNPIYWLFLAVPFNLTLLELDEFLRYIWLECCGHLSQFTIKYKRYVSYYEPDPYSNSKFEELPMSLPIPIIKIFSPGLKFTHEYDMGTTTELLLEVVGLTNTKKTNEIEILVRNQEPEFICSWCDEKASMIILLDEEEFICEPCSESKIKYKPYLLPLVNSPRTGVCGYEG